MQKGGKEVRVVDVDGNLGEDISEGELGLLQTVF